MQYSVATEEKSFREESGIEAGLRTGNETHFRQLKTVGQEKALTTRQNGSPRMRGFCLRVLSDSGTVEL